jgi:hypothetical protein
MKHIHTTVAGDRFIQPSHDRLRWSEKNRRRAGFATHFLTASAALAGVLGLLGIAAFLSTK